MSSDQNEIIARNKKEIFKALEAFHHHCLTHDHVLKEISKVGLAEIDNGWRGLEIQLVEEVVGPVLGQSYILNISLSGRNVFYQKWKRIVRFPLNTMMAALKDASEQVVRENAELIVKVLKELLERLSLAEDETSEVLAPIGK